MTKTKTTKIKKFLLFLNEFKQFSSIQPTTITLKMIKKALGVLIKRNYGSSYKRINLGQGFEKNAPCRAFLLRQNNTASTRIGTQSFFYLKLLFFIYLVKKILLNKYLKIRFSKENRFYFIRRI